MPLSIRSEIPAPELNRSRLRSLTRRLLRAERRPESTEVSLLLCDDAAIRALNREYRGQDRSTDVLSFRQEEGPPLPLGWADEAIPHPLGDVAISLETARRQAEDFGWTVQDEVEALVSHGLLHLLGYDHTTPEEEAVMRKREDELLGSKSIWTRSKDRAAALIAPDGKDRAAAPIDPDGSEADGEV